MPESARLREEYEANGYCVLKQAASPEVTRAMLGLVWTGIFRAGMREKFIMRPGPERPTVTTKPSYELPGHASPILLGFHWGLTARLNDVTGKRLAPSYCYFRTYQKDDVCVVHSDRDSCDHSASLALGYSDDIVWTLDIGHERRDAGFPPADDFGDEPFSRIALSPGDAVAYKGVQHRHGRITPNPNRWSAHLFLHWVDLDGPYRDWAFDKRPPPAPGEFVFGDERLRG